VGAGLRLRIDGSNGVARRCLVEFTIVGPVTWQSAPVAFVRPLDRDGPSVAQRARDEGCAR